MGVTKRAGRRKEEDNWSTAAVKGKNDNPRPKKATYEIKKKEVGLTDLTLISKITNEAINDNLKLRFDNAQIYTYIGHVLVSVNPFRDLGLYTEEELRRYKGRNRLEVSPHVFAIAESAYKNMKMYKQNQCVIISGESGAGKTEAAKRIMQYIATVSADPETDAEAVQKTFGTKRPDDGGQRPKGQLQEKSKEEIQRERLEKAEAIKRINNKVLATNPLLESFGNAKTLRNNNSSRFGKYLELQFNNSEPVGANITNYLLEKSRVVGQVVNERNFHIFYQFAKAASPEQRETFGLRTPEEYEYLRRSKCLDVPGIDDHGEFRETLKAMDIIQIAPEEKDNIFRMLAAILWIGNISFQEDDSGNAAIVDMSVTAFAAYLLEVDADHIVKALTLRVVETSRGGRRGSIYEVPLNRVQALAVRDALAKAIYFNLFDRIVNRVNKELKATGTVQTSVGILDIYGFEIFEQNNFEQLCINYVNEKLQQIFIQLTLRAEQEEYAREQITWTPIKYFDNKVVCQLIEEKKPPGVFAALNDACATAHADTGAADQTFAQRLNALSSNQHFQPRQGQFVIKHYAGDVNYTIGGMTDKNKDSLLKDLLNLVGESRNEFLHILFPNQVNQDDKRRPPTAGDKIKASANELVTTLMQAEPSYIRTIKPNDNKSPSEYNTGNVLHQIKYLGLQENVRIRRAGFADRRDFEHFLEHFVCLSHRIGDAGEVSKEFHGTALDGTKIILRDTSTPRDQYQIGTSKVFIKDPETIFALEKLKERFFANMATRIQRAYRNYIAYRVECIVRIQRFWRKVNGGEPLQKLRDQGHSVLAGRKERRRFSLIGSRRYLGDYLAVNDKQGFGRTVRESIRLSDQEMATFSCRCDLLVTKFGRSSKPEPRILILTRKAVYVVVIGVVNKQISITSERTIPLGAIKYVSLSALKDDWFSLGVSSSQEPDPLINCVFKTEFITHLHNSMPGGGLNLRIGESVEYNKKPGKPSVVKAIKDPSVQRDDYYKSGAIHTGPGEPPNSRSRKTPKPKPGQAKAITKGKLIRPGGPGQKPAKAATRTKDSGAAEIRSIPTRPPVSSRPEARAPPDVVQPQHSHPQAPARSTPHADVTQHELVQQPLAAVNGISHMHNKSSRKPAAPPLPPTAPTAPPPSKLLYKALYDFRPSGAAGEIEGGVNAGETVEALSEQVINGGWLQVRKNNGTTGFAPAAYLEKQEYTPPLPPPPPPAAVTRPTPPPPPSAHQNGANGANGFANKPIVKAKPTPPAPPKRPGAGGRKPPPPPTPRDSAVSMSSSNGGSGRDTPDSSVDGNSRAPSLAMGLAEQLKRRQKATQGKDEGDDDCQIPDLKCGLACFCLGSLNDIITHIQAHNASATTLPVQPKHITPPIRRWASQHACFKQWAGLALLADRDEYKDRLFDIQLDNHATPVQRARVRERVVGVLEGLINKLKLTLEGMNQAAPILSPPQIVVSQPGATPETIPAPPAPKLPAAPMDSATLPLPAGPAAAQLHSAEPTDESSNQPITSSPQHTAKQTQIGSQPKVTLPTIERIHFDITRLYYLTNTVRLTPLCPTSEPPRDFKGNVVYCTPVRALTQDEKQYFDDWVEMLGWEAKAGLEALPELAMPEKGEKELGEGNHPPEGYVEWSWFHGEGSVMPPVVGKWRKLRDEEVGKRGDVWKRVGWGGGNAGGSNKQKDREKDDDEDKGANTVKG